LYIEFYNFKEISTMSKTYKEKEKEERIKKEKFFNKL
jgi:hypothetical protein